MKAHKLIGLLIIIITLALAGFAATATAQEPPEKEPPECSPWVHVRAHGHNGQSITISLTWGGITCPGADEFIQVLVTFADGDRIIYQTPAMPWQALPEMPQTIPNQAPEWAPDIYVHAFIECMECGHEGLDWKHYINQVDDGGPPIPLDGPWFLRKLWAIINGEDYKPQCVDPDEAMPHY